MADSSGSSLKEDSFAEILAKISANRKTSHPWTRGEPHPQPYYAFSDGGWQPVNPSTGINSATSTQKSMAVLSWNIDFMRACPDERMIAALNHVQRLIQDAQTPQIIMFNEMMVSDLQLIQSQLWVQRSYHLTDISSKYWESGYYGTCVLVPKVLHVSRVFRVHYEITNMERDALFIDMALSTKILRVCSTHLESLIADPPVRPHQLAVAANFMHNIDAAVLGGDLNAIQPFDKDLHLENDLKDAYLVTGGEEGAESGMTWGQMANTASRNQFGLSRMDKLLFCGSAEVENFQTFGMDVEVEDEALRPRLAEVSKMEKGWVTDHLGVKADFKILV